MNLGMFIWLNFFIVEGVKLKLIFYSPITLKNELASKMAKIN